MRRTKSHSTETLTQSNVGIGDRLASDETLTYQLHDFWACGKLAVIEAVSGFKLREIDDSYPRCLKLRTIWLYRRVDLSETINITRDETRSTQGSVVARREKREARMVFAHRAVLFAEHIHVEIRGRENDIANLRINTLVADRHLAQSFNRQPTAHGMSHDSDIFYTRIFGDFTQSRFKCIA